MTPLDPDRTLALSYIPAARRAAVAALWRLDAALGAVLAAGREPMVSRIKLAWWREALDALDTAPAPAEPVLEALSKHVLPHGVIGRELAEMEAGWSILLDEHPLGAAELRRYAAARGAILFGLSARLLGQAATEEQRRGGEVWALVDLARHSAEPDAGAALAMARERLVRTDWAKMLRPLGMLAMLATRDAQSQGSLEIQGAPARMLRMLRHRLTGR